MSAYPGQPATSPYPQPGYQRNQAYPLQVVAQYPPTAYPTQPYPAGHSPVHYPPAAYPGQPVPVGGYAPYPQQQGGNVVVQPQSTTTE